MTTAIALKDITIYPVVEQQGPFFDVFEFFPTLTKELLEENRAWLQPKVAAQRAQIVKSECAFNESIQVIPTPGHTIDHYSVLVGRPGRDALITGDMIHSPIQGKYPELGMRADYDSRQAGQTRRQVFDRFCDAATVMCVTHFPSPSTGRVRRWGEGYKFAAWAFRAILLPFPTTLTVRQPRAVVALATINTSGTGEKKKTLRRPAKRFGEEVAERGYSSAPTMPPASPASSSPSTAAALSSNRRHAPCRGT